MTRIAIIGATITGNQGANAMLQTVIQTLSKEIADVKFDVLTYYPKSDREANRNADVNIVSATPINLAFVTLPLAMLYKVLRVLHLPRSFLAKHKTVNAILNADLMIDIAGVSFIDGRTIYLPYNIACVWPPILLKTKLIKYSQAIGPFKKFLNKLCAKFLLPKVDKIVARGKKTRDNLESLGLTNTTLLAESTFSLKIDKDITEKIEEYKEDDIFKKKVVGISPSSVVDSYCAKHKIPYTKIMAEFIDYLNEKNYNAILIPHSYRKNSKKTKNNDLMVSNMIMNKVKYKSGCKIIGEGLGPEELRALIGLTSYFIGARFHAMISSLATKVPTIVCGWSHKYKEVLEMFGLEEYCFDYKSLDLETVKERFEFLLKNEESVKEKLDKHLPEVIESSDEHINLVKNMIEP